METSTPLNSVSTLLLKNRQASFDSFVVGLTKNASALYFAGGDQWTYYNYWKGSPLQDAITNSIYPNRPIGGTSAGNAAQPQNVYTAQFGSATSVESLLDPYNKYVTIGTDFINSGGYLQNLITDTHFYERNRMGRLVSFVSRMATDSYAPLPDINDVSKKNCVDMKYGARGIGVDEATALLIDDDYSVSIVSWSSTGSAYLLCVDALPQQCAPDENLIVDNISTVRLLGNATNIFDLKTWNVIDTKSSNYVTYSLSADNGHLTSTQDGGSIY